MRLNRSQPIKKTRVERILSSSRFFKSNRKKAVLIYFILVFAIVVVAFVSAIGQGMANDVITANLKPYEQFSYISKKTDELYIKEDLLQAIKNFPETDRTISASLNFTTFNSTLGTISAVLYGIPDHEDLKYVLKLCDLELAEGSYPQSGQPEIILHENILKNRDLEIGDYIGNDVEHDIWLMGKYKIVGSLKGDILMGFTNQLFFGEIGDDKNAELIIIPKEGNLSTLNEKLNSINKSDAQIITYSSHEKMIYENIATAQSLLQTIILVVLASMSLAVSAFIYIIYKGRMEEFGILYAIGYNKRFIKNLILKELTRISCKCWVGGFFLSIVLIKTLNLAYLNPMGLSLQLFTTFGLINTLIVPTMMLIFATAPVLNYIKKWDPISVIERRD